MLNTPEAIHNNEQPPFLSIITASFNNFYTIKKTLESIKNQAFKDYEHIVVDGLSNDGTKEIIKSYAGQYNLNYIFEMDEGISDAVNKGLKRVNGKYILILHADDELINPKILEKVYQTIKFERFDIYSFPVLVNYKRTGSKPYKPFPLHWWYHFKTIIPHQGAFVHRRVYEKIGGYNTDFKIAMDYDFFYRAFKAKCSVSLQKDFVSVMGDSGISNNKNFLKKRLDEEYKVQKMNEDKMLWKIAQKIFRFLYVPYKTRLMTKF